MKKIFNFFQVIFHICTSIIGYNIHGSIGWAIFDWVFAPLVWIKWIFFKDVNLTIIKQSFNFFFQ